MNQALSRTVVVAGFIFTLNGAASWGQVPNTNDKSDSDTYNNTGGGTGALGKVTPDTPNIGDGRSNTAYGFDALLFNTSGRSNTAVGFSALRSGTGNYNTANGAEALRFNLTGNYNTAMGSSALYGDPILGSSG